MTGDQLAQLRLLRDELTADVMLCTTRDAHIRLVQRIARLDLVLEQIDASSQIV